MNKSTATTGAPPSLDMKLLYGDHPTREDKALRKILGGIDDGDFVISTKREFSAVKDALEDEHPDLFKRFLKLSSRRGERAAGPKITTADEAAGEARNFLKSSWASRNLTYMGDKQPRAVTDCGSYFSMTVSDRITLREYELRVDKDKGKVTEVQELSFVWGGVLGGARPKTGVDGYY